MSKKLQPLSTGSLKRVLNGDDVPCPLYFQVLGSKKIPSNNDVNDRCRLVLSDGEHQHGYTMLSAHLNDKFNKGEYSQFSIIRVDRYVPSRVNRNVPNDKNVLILFDIETIHPGSEVGYQITASGSGQSNTPAPAPAAAPPQKENINSYSRFSSNATSSSTQQNLGNLSLNSSIAGDLSEHLTMPIQSLSPYQNKWVIKARVTAKSPIRSWKNAKGEGKLFSVDFCDETGEIRCTGFRESVDKFYELLEVDKVYYISRCQLKPANKQYSKLNNDYEMTMSNDTQIQVCNEETTSIPKIRYNITPINKLAEKNKDEFVDVMGVCREVGQVTEITAKSSGNKLLKREITLVDQSNASIVLTLWGVEAEKFGGFDLPVLLIKNARIGEYGGGKTLGTISSSMLLVNPDMPEAHQLKGWYDNNGQDATFNGLSTRIGGNMASEWATFSDCVTKRLGQDKPDYFQTMAMIHTVRSENMLYKACSNDNCNKKVVEHDNGTYRCEKCNATLASYNNRLLVNMLIGDWTSNKWVTLFAETGEKVFGKSTDELASMLEHDKAAFDSTINDVLFKPQIFKIRARIETYGDVPRTKFTCLAVGETKRSDYNKHLIENIRRLTGVGIPAS